MAEKKNIYETIILVMDEVGVIGKEKRNKSQGFMYRGVDDVMNALNPAFIKHHLFMVPEVLEQSREERKTKSDGNLIYSVCKVKYTFYAEDGSFIEAVVVGEGMDSGDKASNKALAVAFKYACFQIFCIPTEEMKDPDEENQPSSIMLITEKEKKFFISECKRIGKAEKAVLKALDVANLDVMTMEQFKIAKEKFERTPSVSKSEKPDPSTIPPDDVECGLPFN